MEYLEGERCGNKLLNNIIECSGEKEKGSLVLSEYSYGASMGKGYGCGGILFCYKTKLNKKVE